MQKDIFVLGIIVHLRYYLRTVQWMTLELYSLRCIVMAKMG